MLRRSAILQFDQPDTIDDTFTRTHLSRRGKQYRAGTQAHCRSRAYYFLTAPVPGNTSDADAEFVIRARRRKPMAHTVATEEWTPVTDPTDPWTLDTPPTDIWS